jgi:16S rRNA (cytosine967-C5)-methyltransferase
VTEPRGNKISRKRPGRKPKARADQGAAGKPGSGNPRLVALSALAEVLDDGKSLPESVALGHSVDDDGGRRNPSQARHLAYGVLRWQVPLAWLEGRLLDKPLKQKDRDLSRLIWLGLFQLWQDRTPDHAAINETTECARALGKAWAVNLVNAVLRRFQREQESLLAELAAVPEHLAHPAWLLTALQRDWPQHWKAIVAANNQPPPLWIRVNRRITSAAAVAQRLGAAGFSALPHVFAPEALLVSPAAGVSELPGFAEGWFSIQDAAAQLAAGLLDVQPGMRVLDACAAPGGKTCHLLELHPGIHLTALDIYPNRLQRVRENLDRLQLECELRVADAGDPSAWWNGQPFDRILLDAPCTATGVIRRHPEIRHLRQAAQVQEAVRLQQQLLQRLWPLLAPGGMLLYATCSVFQDENSNQVKEFLAGHDDATEQVIDAGWGQATQHGRQILPGDADMDGFYYACLRKHA